MCKIQNEPKTIHVTKINVYEKFKSSMVGTHILYIFCARNVMVNLFSKEIFEADQQNLFNYHTSEY